MLPAGLRQPPNGLQEPCFSLTPCQAMFQKQLNPVIMQHKGKVVWKNHTLREAPPPSDHHRMLRGHSCQCFVRLELRGQPENPLLTCFCSTPVLGKETPRSRLSPPASWDAGTTQRYDLGTGMSQENSDLPHTCCQLPPYTLGHGSS